MLTHFYIIVYYTLYKSVTNHYIVTVDDDSHCIIACSNSIH